jgi:OFA family oxalate/formate antiporter-like MFS transporter
VSRAPCPHPDSRPAEIATLVEPLLSQESNGALFRGWLVVVGAFLVVMVGYGAMYSYAAFAEEIGATFDAESASVTLVFALSGGSCFFVSALTGPLADRVGARVLATAGMVLVGVGLTLAAAARSLTEVYVGYGLLIGIGAGFAYVPAVAAVQRWFDAHRGLASGIAVSGVGVGTALVPPAADALALLGDWRLAFQICGIGAILVGLPGAMLLLPSPEKFSFAAKGDPERPTRTSQTQQNLAEVCGRAFGLAYLGILLVSCAVTLPYAMLVETARGIGVERHDALALLTLIGIGSIAGRFALAALADAVGRRATFLGCCVGLAAAMLIWAVAVDLATLRTFALLFGALHGGFIALLPAFVADSFGVHRVGGVLGVLFTSRGIALLAAPPVVAFGIGAMAGHLVPVLGVAVVGAVGSALLGRVEHPSPPRRPSPQLPCKVIHTDRRARTG